MFRIQPHPVEQPHPLDYRFTWILIVAAAVLTVRFHSGYDLSFLTMEYGTLANEPWRLLTACLLHGNTLHLLFNLAWTWRFGQILEPIVGLVPMVAICVVLGAGSMAAEWAFFRGGIGLSGVGYGLFGVLWAMNRFAPNYRGVMDKRTAEMFAVWFFLCIAFTYFNVMPVANVAHGVGALLGGLIGLLFSPFAGKRRAGTAGLIAALALIGVLSTVGRPYVNLGSQRGWELAYDGTNALEAGDLERAERLLLEALERDPSQAWAWFNLGIVYGRTQRYTESERAFQRAEELNPEYTR